jgi:hypothetical protein
LVEALELFFDSLDLPPRRGALRLIQFHGLRARQPPMSALQNRRRHLQVAHHFGGRPGWCCCLLPLRFEEQRRIIKNALPDRGRCPAPSRIQQPSFARVAAMLGEDRRHALAVLETLPRHRRQKLHRHLRADLSGPHLLLNRFRQKLD